MKNALRQLLNPEIPLKRRLFQLLSSIALAEFLIVTVYTLVSGGDVYHFIIMLAGTVIFAVTATRTSKSGRTTVGTTVSGLLYFALYPLTFFSSGGMYGGAPVVFAFALIYVFLVTEKVQRAICLSLCIIATMGCYLLAYLHPELLSRHTVEMEYTESLLSVFLVTLLICTLFAFVTRVYREENRIVQKQKKEIEALNQVQKQFFSKMSHEIRTPVNAIIGLNEMNLREELTTEVRENSQNIEIAGRVLLHTINEILDMSKLETGGMEIISAEYHTTDMLSEIVSMIWLRAKEKGLDFSLSVDPTLPRKLYGDEVRIRQVLLNVTTNAVKYTKEGSVTLSLCGEHRDDGSFVMLYDIRDTGIGIKEENIPYLFDAFQRIDIQQTHRIEGSGLGLSIVKQLLDMMGGTISVESEYGKGSVFHIEIPQQIADPEPVGTFTVKTGEKTEAYTSCLPALRILAVDDTPMNLMVVKKLLRDTKAEVDTAASGAEALALTEKSRYDVILMDHQMPEMDGIECLHRIRSQTDGKCRDSKVICLTANYGADMEDIYRKEGFDGYLVKPVKGKLLESEIANQVKA